MSAIIQAKNLNFSYANNLVLDNVSFSVDAGDYVGIVGPNGGGKTTLLKILVGLLEASSGELLINGQPVKKTDSKTIGYVPQRIAQESVTFPATVCEMVETGLLAGGSLLQPFGPNEKALVDNALNIAGIYNLKNRLIGRLSGGQRQRAYVARALVGRPKILILDEPFVGIDAGAQKEFYGFLKRLNEVEKITILFVSHDLDIIAEEVKSVLCLNKGILCLSEPGQLHEADVLENLYGKKITHIHHHSH